MHSRASLSSILGLVLIGCGGTPEGADDGSSGADPATSADSEAPGTDPGDPATDSGEPTTDADEPTSEPGTDAGDPTTDNPAVTCEQVPLACEDAAIQDLSLQEKVSMGEVSGALDGGDWVNQLDATAGGTANAAMNAWLYLRFTDDGLVKVDIDDIAALGSNAWDIAAKRYGIRVNSGSSGPSCVTVAAATGAYAAVSAAPAESEFAAESYFGADCSLIQDSHMLGDPDYRMAAWWDYAGCVKTTGAPFVLRLGDGRAVKLVVEAYYAEGQAACNETNAMGSGSAMMTWRWAFLP